MPTLVKPTNSWAVSKFREFFPPVQRPKEEDFPAMPTKISALRTVDLGDLMSKYAAWREYASSLADEAVAEFTEHLDTYNSERARKACLLSGKPTEKKDVLDSDAELNSIWSDVLQKEMYMKLLNGKVESLNDAVSVISREIARRGQVGVNKFET